MQTTALDDEAYGMLIVSYLQRFGAGSRRDFDALLRGQLPDSFTDEQKDAKIHDLLTKLRKAGQIQSAGPGRVWKLNSNEPGAK